MADLAQLERALINADAAGDVEAAKALAGEIGRLRSQPSPSMPTTPIKIGKDAFGDTLRQVLQEADWGTRNIAGAGTALSDLWQGAKQLVGAGDKQAIEANNIIKEEAPIGSIAGNMAMLAPLGAAVPAFNTIKGATALGAGLGALSPTIDENVLQGKAINTALGGAGGAAGQVAGQYVGKKLGEKAARLAVKKAQDEPINATIREAVDAGYVIPPGQVNPSFKNRVLESVGGKIATQQMAANKNQTVTDALARKAAGLADDAPITPQTLQAARDIIKKPYQEIAGLGLQKELDDLDEVRAGARAAWNEYKTQKTRSALNDYKALSSQAKQLEQGIDSALVKAKRPDLMKQFRDARAALAKNHDVEEALIEGGGTIDARSIARLAQKGAPLTGDLRTIGNFANNFPKITQPDKMVGTPDAHNMKYLASLLLGGGGGAAMGPGGIAAGALPFVTGPAARSAMFSKGAQQSLIPSYDLTPAQKLAQALIARNQVAPLSAYGAMETLGQ